MKYPFISIRLTRFRTPGNAKCWRGCANIESLCTIVAFWREIWHVLWATISLSISLRINFQANPKREMCDIYIFIAYQIQWIRTKEYHVALEVTDKLHTKVKNIFVSEQKKKQNEKCCNSHHIHNTAHETTCISQNTYNKNYI